MACAGRHIVCVMEGLVYIEECILPRQSVSAVETLVQIVH